MAIRESELKMLVPELAQMLIGRSISNMWQPSRSTVVLGFSSGILLLLCPRGPDARLHTVGRRPKNPRSPFSFQGACRAHLHGPLTDLVLDPDDRIVDLHFGAHRLHLRLTGNIGGLWLLQGDAILAAYDGPAPSVLPSIQAGGKRDLPPRMEEGPGGWDRSIAHFFAVRIAARREQELRVVVARGLRKEIQRLARLASHLDDDLRRAGRADQVREQADALAARLHTLRPGPDHVDLPSLEDPGRLLTVPLLPGKAPSASLNKLYNKARRLERMGEAVLERIDKTERTLVELRALQEGLEDRTLAELQTLRDRYQQHRSELQTTGFPGITVWTGPNAERVLVGRDAKANRRLTFQMGKGSDWWMHRRGSPGAHLLLKLPRNQTPSLELLLAAAQIAAVHAGVVEGARCEVQYARIRDIRSIPGSLSSVRVHNEKVLEVVRESSVLSGWARS